MKIIIGASGGIGSKLFKHYRAREMDVIGTHNKRFCKPKDMDTVHLDITAPSSIRKFVYEINPCGGEVSLINCAGINYNCMAHKADTILWGRVIDTNLIGTFNIISALLPHMRKNNHGRIINMSSVVAQMGVVGTSAYAASKAGLWGMTKAIAAENKDKGITINNLNLGYMDAGMALKLPVDKRGSIDNIINAIDFLVDSDFVTGTSIDINGGIL